MKAKYHCLTDHCIWHSTRLRRIHIINGGSMYCKVYRFNMTEFNQIRNWRWFFLLGGGGVSGQKPSLVLLTVYNTTMVKIYQLLVDSPARCVSQLLYSYGNELRCCWIGEGVWGRTPSRGWVGTRDFTATERMNGIGCSKLVNFN